MKKILTSILLPALVISPFFIISCTKKINIVVNEPWREYSKFNFFDDIEKKYNELLNSNVKFNISFRGENNDLAHEIIKGSSDIGSVTTTLYYRNRQFLDPIIQTKTYSFTFDKQFDVFYKDGSNNDPLVSLAKKAEIIFNQKKFVEWDDQEYGWDGIKYNYFYDNELVDYYRGNVLIWGNDNELKSIKEAWNKKDWNTFRNFGILHGKETSSSKYILQELLFRKHFTNSNNKFTSFIKDKENNSNKYKQGSARDLSKGENSNYHIVFDELGSYAYTHNTKKNKKLNYFETLNPNNKIEFLIVTEPIKYNVFAVSKYMKEFEKSALSNAIFENWKNKKDDYGPHVGFNGYKIITNKEEEVIKPYERLFK
ncbi:ABC transporter substrate-binding protein [Metamycoplasma hyosynoviae]|uniref:ABC transporter substrate-binding protein n=1 Tax=Metamycoplasma hyosynoviae TaxID=29559 RepID=A0AAP4AL08_9BACT|nr:ABC transporter substrate-binding protein [Metamycoplasma hyosynoviae]MDI3047821.1 ABC transporter substrate-binding protein [Metamycoplasma hyosynoviae]MDI3102616.1 ABC transporter substrate-binding protein [Metamycoplasma hyosynoviae]MDI3117919.1 ABC transporter substrate-binding protein [Metamycoplasma hyosynoviae]